MSATTESNAVLILGGYGTFGQLIARGLVKQGRHVIINGRQQRPAEQLRTQLIKGHRDARVSVACFDVHQGLSAQLEHWRPALVIHTCGPFQAQNTQVARAVLSAGIHYLDLADSRDYVAQMQELHNLALHHQVSAITAASTVPALSSAVLTWLQKTHHIERFNRVRMGITPGQKTPRGLATTRAVLSYLGQTMRPWPGSGQRRWGWMDLYRQPYPNIGGRLMGNCEAPDLDVLSDHYDIGQLQFSAGMDSKLLHLLMWLTAGMIRLGLPVKLSHRASALLRISHWFDVLGSADGGMHVEIEATNSQGKEVNLTWFIEAFDGCGPQIPATPAVVLTDKILRGSMAAGVSPCVNLLSLEEYLDALSGLRIETSVKRR